MTRFTLKHVFSSLLQEPTPDTGSLLQNSLSMTFVIYYTCMFHNYVQLSVITYKLSNSLFWICDVATYNVNNLNFRIIIETLSSVKVKLVKFWVIKNSSTISNENKMKLLI